MLHGSKCFGDVKLVNNVRGTWMVFLGFISKRMYLFVVAPSNNYVRMGLVNLVFTPRK